MMSSMMSVSEMSEMLSGPDIFHGLTELGRELLYWVVAWQLQPERKMTRRDKTRQDVIWLIWLIWPLPLFCYVFKWDAMKMTIRLEVKLWRLWTSQGLDSFVQVCARGKLPFGCAATTAISAAARPWESENWGQIQKYHGCQHWILIHNIS